MKLNRNFILIGAGVMVYVYFNKLKPTKWSYPKVANKYRTQIVAVEREYGIPVNLLGRLLQQESDFNPYAHNTGSNAQGIAQIVPRWHPEIKDPFNPEEAIPYAGKYLAKLYKNFDHWDLALAAYNWGWGNLRKHLERYGPDGFIHLPKETRNYVSEILSDIR